MKVVPKGWEEMAERAGATVERRVVYVFCDIPYVCGGWDLICGALVSVCFVEFRLYPSSIDW